MEITMKFASAAFAALLVATSAAYAGEETRNYNDLPDFDRLDVSAGVVMIAEVGDKRSITVTTDDGDFSDFEIGVKNGVLSVSREWNRLRWHGSRSNYTVTVVAPDIRGLDASSGSHASVSKIDAGVFAIDVSSGARAELDGACGSCVIDISSGADLAAKGLTCGIAEIDVSSGGHGKVTVVSSVVGDASSGGHVSVYGNPQKVSTDKSSGGRIKIVASAQAIAD